MISDFDIEGYCKDNLKKVSMTGTKQIMSECPWCGKYGGFYINSNTGDYICFKCDKRGKRLIGLISEIEGLTWTEASSFLMSRVVKFRRRKYTTNDLLKKLFDLNKDFGIKNDIKEFVNCDLPKGFIPIWDGNTWKYPKYLKKRGITKNTCKEWELGYCNFGKFSHRLIIPIDCPNGKSFTARDMVGNREPRYKNPKNISHSRLLLGWDKINRKSDIILVEGPIDAIKMWQYGFSALSLLGKVLHKFQEKLIMEYFPIDTSIIVMLDPEEIKAPLDVAKKLACRFDDVYIAKLPKGVDPGSANVDQLSDSINNSKHWEFFKTSVLNEKLRKIKIKFS